MLNYANNNKIILRGDVAFKLHLKFNRFIAAAKGVTVIFPVFMSF
jgi:hypothetical protein